jgi:hypothetical protein
MRLRQLVIVAEERDLIATQICDVFDLKVAFTMMALFTLVL